MQEILAYLLVEAPIFTEREEDASVVYLEIFINMGLNIRDRDLLDKANQMLSLKRNQSPECSNLPETIGQAWLRGFYRRHQYLTKKRGETTDPERFMLSKEKLTN